MKILIIGGMHGNEPLGLEVVSLLQKENLSSVDTLLANQQAITASSRFIVRDLNRTFPGNERSNDYETKRASEIVQLCRNYDLVIDFHNTYSPDNDCSFIGWSAEKLLYGVSEWLGLIRIVVADYDCLNKYASNCISVEISLSSQRRSASDWVEKIIELAQIKDIPVPKNLELYRFVYRITLEDQERLKLEAKNLHAFQALDKSLTEMLGVKSPAYPIFIADLYTPYNFGGLLNRITV